MKKLTFLLPAALLCMAACQQRQSPQQLTNPAVNNKPSDTSVLSASWQVKGCAEKKVQGTDGVTKGAVPDGIDPVNKYGPDGFTVSKDSVVYTRTVSHLCCRTVKLQAIRKDNTITVTEYWQGKGCKCHCSSSVSLQIRQLPPGRYQLFAVETGTNPVDDLPSPGRDTILRQGIIIR